MALTLDEENYLKEMKKRDDVEKQITILNSQANISIEAKRAEIKAIQDKLVQDVQTAKTAK